MADKKTKSSAEAMATDGFEKELIETLDKIEKAYGKGAIMKLGDKSHIDTEVIPTGSMLIDNALGVGGYPKGRIIEIYGPESSGKTTLALHAIAQTQKLGGRAAFIDAENAIDPEYAAALGVDIDNLLLSQPSSGEEALEITELLANSKAIDLIVVDSVAALVPKAEIEASLDTSSVGTQARMMSKALRRLAGILNRTNTTVIFINQLREKMNTMGYGGPTETTSGGRALKFYASIRIEIKKLSQILKTKLHHHLRQHKLQSFMEKEFPILMKLLIVLSPISLLNNQALGSPMVTKKLVKENKTPKSLLKNIQKLCLN